ncbi:MAG TPA: response regulator [Gemmatimonadales bacterium]|nr:response regulator [Gemmatimonadales bacterium]
MTDTSVDPLVQVRAEFADSLGARIDSMRAALRHLESAFRSPDAEALYRAAHSLTGTAGSFGADVLAHVAGDLEGLTRGWLARGTVPADEWLAASSAIVELEAAAREYRATAPVGRLHSPAARLAVVGELTSLIHAAADMHEIFRGAILKVQRVLDFRRASVVLIDSGAPPTTYSLHTLYDRARGGFIGGQAVFPVHQGITGDAIRTGRPIRVDALPGREGILLEADKRISAMIVPLHVNDRVIGTLNFGHEDESVYTDEDLDWAVVLGRQIETSLYYSKLLSTISEQRAALAREHAALQAQRDQLEALIDASDAAIMFVGADRRVAHANAAMAQILGIPRETVLGTPLESAHRFLASSFVTPGALAQQEDALAHDVPLRDRVELTFPRRGIYQRVVAPVRPSGAPGPLMGHIVLYRDVSHEVEVERAKSEFVSIVSHELRTPMTSVKTSLSLLLSGAGGSFGGEARELLEIAHRNTDRLIRLINDLLDLSRLEAGRFELHAEPVALAAAVEASVDAVAGFARDQNVTVVLEPPPVPVTVLGVRDRVEQVIVNLLGNAIKFSPRGADVLVRWHADQHTATIEVVDHGAGIAPQHLDAIFEPFRQLDSSTTREHGGAGLGLTISRDIVRALGGQLRVESEIGQGSRFFMQLPLAATLPLREADVRPAPPGRESPSVTIAHSDADWRRLVGAQAEAAGWKITSVATGAAALVTMQRHRPDLLILAHELSDVHGLTVLQQLQVDPRLFDVPVVLAAEADSAVEEEAGLELVTTVEGVIERARKLLAEPRRPVVLMVEDDPILRPTISKFLRREGYLCIGVSNGREALEIARTRRPDLIITDFRMPEVSGLALLEELRKDAALAAVPAIMLTGHLTAELARQVMRLNAKIASKPIQPKLLLADVRRLLAQ